MKVYLGKDMVWEMNLHSY